MALKNLICLILLSTVINAELLHAPFPQGYSMGTLGTVIYDNASGKITQETISPAGFYSGRNSMYLSFVSYFDKMDNLADRQMYSFSLGAIHRREKISVNAEISCFDALSTYYEQTGTLSFGYTPVSLLRLGLWASGQRQSIKGAENASHLDGTIGCSAGIIFTKVMFTLKCENVVVKKASAAGADPPLKVTLGIHSAASRLGVQGFLFEIEPQYEKTLRVKIGEEFWLCRWLGLQFSFAGNPLQVGLGMCVSVCKGLFSASLVHNEQLGWSEGFFLGVSPKGRK